ncbi:phosphatase domain-containing protein [Streptomyces chattanoogensis]|uniref:phosphatase domain-containing protein n=1 Tax=Streptomyces chattanoogensis TaxID=66876 RepID=UPI0005DA608D|nr:hypothetical protein T261_1090 [Streptomyces lydicus]
MTTRPLAVFDLDGTLADSGHRQHLLQRRPRDWNAFFAAATQDPPLAEGVTLALRSAEDCEVVYLTGRPERCRRDTLAWLGRHGLPEGRLWMRPNADRRPARQTKLETLHRMARGREVRHVVDDDELVCAACEAAGFTVIRARWAGPPSAVLKDAQGRAGRT